MDYAVNAVAVDGFQEVVQAGDVAAIDGDAVHHGLQVGARGSEVEADDVLAAFDELADDAVADEPGAAGDHHGH